MEWNRYCKVVDESYELKLIRKDGSPYWVIISAKPLFDNAGKFKGILGMLTDITEHKQAEITLQEAYENIRIQSEELQAQSEELQVQNEEIRVQNEEMQIQAGELREAYGALSRSEKRYRMLFSSMSEAFILSEVIYDKNGKPDDFRFIEVNPAYERLSGYTQEQLLGKTMLQVFPNTRPITIEKYCNAVIIGKPVHFEILSNVVNGKFFDVNAYTPETGKLAVILRDITERRQAEDALQESEARFRSVLDNSIDVIYRVNMQTGRYEYISPSVETVVGFTSDEFMALDTEMSRAMVYPDDLPSVLEVLEHLEDTGEGDAEYRQRTKTGDYIWISNHMSLTTDRTGRPLYRDGNIRDITESKKAEDALRESEERFRAVQENSLDRFTILKPFYDDHGEIIDFTYIYQNARAAKTTGRSPEELVGRRMTEIFPTFPQTRFFPIYKLAVETGQVTEFEDHYHVDGVDDWFYAKVTPIPDGIAIATQIITERKQAEEALRQSEKHYRLLFENMTDAFYLTEVIYDKSGKPCDYRFLEVNPAYDTQIGVKREELLGKTLMEVFPNTRPTTIEKYRAQQSQVDHRISKFLVMRLTANILMLMCLALKKGNSQ